MLEFMPKRIILPKDRTIMEHIVMKIEKAVGIAFITVLLVLLPLEFSALRHNWYFHHPWSDMPMHTLLGIAFGLAGIFVFCRIVRFKRFFPPPITMVFAAMGTAFVIGIGIEVAQYFNESWRHGIGYSFKNGASDVFFDVAGGFLAGIYGMLIEEHM